jgi:hypothetical protein
VAEQRHPAGIPDRPARPDPALRDPRRRGARRGDGNKVSMVGVVYKAILGLLIYRQFD